MRPSELLKLKRDEILALAAKAGARNVRVFGSAARGDDSEESDVDQTGLSLEFLKARMLSIAGGTNEMQRNGIGERVLGLPREPSFDSNKPFSEVIREARNWNGRIG